AGALAASRLGWHWVFACLSAGAALMFLVALARLPAETIHEHREPNRGRFLDHFRKRDRFAGIVAAFLTSGGIVGFLTYVGAWLKTSFDMGIDRIGLLFLVYGMAAVVGSPLLGWLSFRVG